MDICGHTEFINGREWICDRVPHDTEERPEPLIQIDHAGAFIPEVVIEGDKHHMVRRYTNR